jgi:hypothetical protein
MTDHAGSADRPAIPDAGLFWRAVPELARIEAALGEALLPAMTQGPAEERGYADVAWMLAKALRFLLQAARAAQDGDAGALDEALAEVDADLLAAAGYARALRAAAATPQALAAAGEAARMNAAGLGECLAAAVTITTVTDTDSGLETDEVRAEADAAGRISLASARHGELPVDGRAQLDLAAALDALSAVCGRGRAARGAL